MMIEQKVIECAAETYGVDAASITRDTNLREDISNQSLKMVMFISNIEEELDVLIDIRDAAKLITIGDFVDKVSEMAGK